MNAWTTLTRWMNAANNAYAMGEADWTHGPGVACYLADLASSRLRIFGDGELGVRMAASAVRRVCVVRGIDLKRHKFHKQQGAA